MKEKCLYMNLIFHYNLRYFMKKTIFCIAKYYGKSGEHESLTNIRGFFIAVCFS